MKSSRRAVTVVISFVFLLCLGNVLVYGHGSHWWHKVSQNERNRLIIEQAKKDVGRKGDQCKAWIQKKINEASDRQVWIPLNRPSPKDWQWDWDQNGHVVGMSAPIENVEIGWIIQMRLKGGIPHTAIVAGKDRRGIIFLDSNWSTTNDEIVRLHYLTFSEFYNNLNTRSSYSVYYIL